MNQLAFPSAAVRELSPQRIERNRVPRLQQFVGRAADRFFGREAVGIGRRTVPVANDILADRAGSPCRA